MPMTIDSFSTLIHALTSIPLDELQGVQELMRTTTVRKGDYFIRVGEMPYRVGFIRKGLFQYHYTHENGTEFTKGFFDKGNVISAYSALLENRASYFSIQALEDAELETVEYTVFRELAASDPRWKQFEYTLLKRGYLVKEEREREFLLFDAEARYAAFQERYPGLEDRVKQRMIASYLGITPESLSRIRRKNKPLT